MTDQRPHTPTRIGLIAAWRRFNGLTLVQARDEVDRVIAAAEQRGAERAFRKTQEIIAGFEHTIDEARERDDMINTGYLIQEIDTEIQDLREDDDA